MDDRNVAKKMRARYGNRRWPQVHDSVCAVRSWLGSTDGVSHKISLTAAMHPVNKLLLSAFDACSDSLLLDVSVVNIDAPPGLISDSPLFSPSDWHQALSRFRLVFHMSPVLFHHLQPTFLVQFLFGNLPCVVQFQRSLGILSYVRTCPECSGVGTIFSLVCHWPTHPLVGSLVPAACSCLSHSTDKRTSSRRASPKHHRPQGVSHKVSLLLLLASARGIHRCGQAC